MQSVKVCALTGVAARLINGTTLHSALKLPVQKDGRIEHVTVNRKLPSNHASTVAVHPVRVHR